MTAMPPSPFISEPVASEGRPQEASAAVALNPHETVDALGLYGIGPCITNDLPVLRAFNEVRRQELIEADHRFVLDERAFMEALEPPPAFLLNPSPEYLRANDLMPVLAVLAGH